MRHYGVGIETRISAEKKAPEAERGSFNTPSLGLSDAKEGTDQESLSHHRSNRGHETVCIVTKTVAWHRNCLENYKSANRSDDKF